jgi:hypothetical protein
MRDATSRYPRKEGVALIEIRLNSLQQRFNSFDPAPFHEKDLDHDPEDYIVGSVGEFPLSAPLRLVFHLPPEQMALAETAKLSDSIHNYFDYRLSAARRRLRFQLRDGRSVRYRLSPWSHSRRSAQGAAPSPLRELAEIGDDVLDLRPAQLQRRHGRMGLARKARRYSGPLRGTAPVSRDRHETDRRRNLWKGVGNLDSLQEEMIILYQ